MFFSFLQRCEETGEDFDLVKLRELGADEVERWERRKKKKNPDTGFAGNVLFRLQNIQLRRSFNGSTTTVLVMII